MSLSTIQAGLAEALSLIDGLRTHAYIPDQVSPPIAIPIPVGITFDTTFARGMDEYSFTVLVLVGSVSDRGSQALMSRYCAPSGDGSIKAAIEADKTLGGAAFDCRVTEMRNYQQTPVGDQMYLSAEFSVQVYAQ